MGYTANMAKDSLALVVMAKFPEAGKVKTRLTPALAPAQAAAIHRAFLLHSIARLGALDGDEMVICFDPPDRAAAMRELLAEDAAQTACHLPATCHPEVLRRIWPRAPIRPDSSDYLRMTSTPLERGEIAHDRPDPFLISYLPQSPGDLGARLASAAATVGQRHPRMLFFGVDSPDLPDSHIDRAIELTQQAAVSVSPTADGGFWSLGLCNSVDASALLSGIRWSSGVEMRQLLERADALGYATAVGEQWDDVDHPADLQRLLHRLSPSTQSSDRALLQQLQTIRPAIELPF